ncbi:hypothetical protein L2E82_28228 [Cichorium intybus]|uniref:Uncharacterized protein n=1 Tax=Cichorium intybus TaxID=13427 RepID=A0ACB9CVB8_CICIN|nr:hypothetical protein L2E82_28228 [Cichorium intybus]
MKMSRLLLPSVMLWYGINGCGVRKGKKQPELDAASIQFTDVLKRQYQISRESATDKNGAISRESVKDKNGAVSMILIREKIESMTKEVGLLDVVSSSPASKEITGVELLAVDQPILKAPLKEGHRDKKLEHIARACWMEWKCFQYGAIEHFPMKCSHAKCEVTGDKPRKERGEKKEETNGREGPLCLGSVTLMSCLNISSTIMDEILEVAIAVSKYVQDIEHLEGSKLISICRDGRAGKQLEEIVFELGSHMAECVIVWSPILFEKKKDKLMCMCIDYRESDILKTRTNMMYICTRYWSYFMEKSDMRSFQV